MQKRVTFPVAVHLFLRDDDSILLLRRFNTGYEDGKYSVIAGHLDGGEDIFTAMIREASEEADIEIERADLRIVQVMHRKSPSDERIDYFFECRKWRSTLRNAEPGKCDELRWVDIEKLPENTIGYIAEAVRNYRQCVPFTLFGWE